MNVFKHCEVVNDTKGTNIILFLSEDEGLVEFSDELGLMECRESVTPKRFEKYVIDYIKRTIPDRVKVSTATVMLGTLLIASFTLGGAGTEAATAGQQSVVQQQNIGTISSGVKMRTAPSTTSTVISVLRTGTKVEILETSTNWLKVNVNGRIGFVSKRFVNVSTIGQEDAPTISKVTVVRGVNFRTAPSTSSSIISSIRAGSELKLVQVVNQYWLKVDHNGRIGYISASPTFVNFERPVQTPPVVAPVVVYPVSAAQPEVITPPSPQPVAGSPTSNNQTRDEIIVSGLKYLGTPYKLGSDRTNTAVMDCSDFVRTAYREGAGVTLPYSSRTQAAFVQKNGIVTENWRELKVGDVMFFVSPKTGDIYHSGIYMGEGKLLHTYSAASGGVRIDKIPGTFWERQFVFGGNVLKD
jgi:cell wall-associated NlpC family hydrolase